MTAIEIGGPRVKLRKLLSYQDFCNYIGQCPIRDMVVEAMEQYKNYKTEFYRREKYYETRTNKR